MNKIIKPGIVLCIICIIAALILGVAYKKTEAPIKAQEEKTKNEAMAEVLPDAETFEELEVTSDTVSAAFAGKKGDEIVGYAIFTNPKGYSPVINLLTGVDTNGVITGISIIGHTETPGLGANATEPKFKDQFKGKSGEVGVTKTAPAKDNEIVAITSATITSKGIATGVNQALEYYNTNLKGGVVNE